MTTYNLKTVQAHLNHKEQTTDKNWHVVMAASNGWLTTKSYKTQRGAESLYAKGWYEQDNYAPWVVIALAEGNTLVKYRGADVLEYRLVVSNAEGSLTSPWQTASIDLYGLYPIIRQGFTATVETRNTWELENA